MNTAMFVTFIVFGAVVIYHSYQVWVDPKEFLRRAEQTREKTYKYSFGILLTKQAKELYDNNPKFVLGLARVFFP